MTSRSATAGSSSDPDADTSQIDAHIASRRSRTLRTALSPTGKSPTPPINRTDSTATDRSEASIPPGAPLGKSLDSADDEDESRFESDFRPETELPERVRAIAGGKEVSGADDLELSPLKEEYVWDGEFAVRQGDG